MKEQSHKQEMSAAVRGDFARLRARGVERTIAPEGDSDTPATDELTPGEPEPDQAPPPSRERRSFLRIFRSG